MIPALEVHDASSGEDRIVGTARFSLRRGMASTTFSYDESWIALGTSAYAIDPSLPLTPSPQHRPGLPGRFAMPRPIVGVACLSNAIGKGRRCGGKEACASSTMSISSWACSIKRGRGRCAFASLAEVFSRPQSRPRLLFSCRGFWRLAETLRGTRQGKTEIKTLLAAGSGSLGGARPKASVRDGERLLLAKFSHSLDEWDVMAWEKTMLDLARGSSIEVPASRLVRIGDESVLLLERFDREGSLAEGRRIPYMSGMTALESADGERRDYAELAEALALGGGGSPASSGLYSCGLRFRWPWGTPTTICATRGCCAAMALGTFRLCSM